MHQVRCFARHAIALAAVAALPSVSAAQEPNTTFPQVTINGRLHTQAYYFDNDDYGDVVGTSANFLIRRARITANVLLSDRVSLRIMPSFENARGRGDLRLRDAYVNLRLNDPGSPSAVTLRFGQEKRPFSRLELTTSNLLPALERGAGPGLIASQSNDLFIGAGYLSDDLGASLIVSSGGFDLRAGVYNGTGDANKDVNDAKSFGARATFDVTPNLNVGGSVFSHDGIVGTDSSFRNTAFEIDAQWGTPGQPGLYVLGEALQGEAFSAADRTMRGLIGWAAYHIRRNGERPMVYAIEPAVRVDVADPDTDADDDGSTLIAGALGLYFTPRAQLRIAVEHQIFQEDALPSITGVRSVIVVNF